MRLLLDTHIAAWLIIAPSRLSREEMDVLRLADTEACISSIAIWELRLKWNSFHPSGDRKGPADPKEALEAFKAIGLVVLPLEPEHAAVPLAHPLDHKDPFDELLLVQAQELGFKLMTRDTKLRDHPLAYSPE